MAASPVEEAVVRQRIALLLLGIAALTPVSRVESGPVLCPVRRVTGRPCPGCGGTRSLVRMMHGDLRGASRAHPVAPALGLLLLGWASTGARSAGSALDPRRWPARPLLVLAVLWVAWAARRALVAR